MKLGGKFLSQTQVIKQSECRSRAQTATRQPALRKALVLPDLIRSSADAARLPYPYQTVLYVSDMQKWAHRYK